MAIKRQKVPSSTRKTMTIDVNTGRRRRKDPKKARVAKVAARKRKGKKLKAVTRMKMSRTHKKVARTGRITRGKHRKAK